VNEAQVRALVREALARHLGEGRVGMEGRAGSPSPALSASSPCATSVAAWKTHLSHGRFIALAPTDPDAPCVVEPQVTCHHCGFCQSYGH
jgi:hypothetical protein